MKNFATTLLVAALSTLMATDAWAAKRQSVPAGTPLAYNLEELNTSLNAGVVPDGRLLAFVYVEESLQTDDGSWLSRVNYLQAEIIPEHEDLLYRALVRLNKYSPEGTIFGLIPVEPKVPVPELPMKYPPERKSELSVPPEVIPMILLLTRSDLEGSIAAWLPTGMWLALWLEYDSDLVGYPTVLQHRQRFVGLDPYPVSARTKIPNAYDLLVNLELPAGDRQTANSWERTMRTLDKKGVPVPDDVADWGERFIANRLETESGHGPNRKLLVSRLNEQLQRGKDPVADHLALGQIYLLGTSYQNALTHLTAAAELSGTQTVEQIMDRVQCLYALEMDNEAWDLLTIPLQAGHTLAQHLCGEIASRSDKNPAICAPVHP